MLPADIHSWLAATDYLQEQCVCLCHRCLRWGFHFYSAPSKTSSSMFPTVKILWYVSVRFWCSVSASLGVSAALLCSNQLWPHCTCKSRCSLISVHNGQILITWNCTHLTFVIVRVKLYGIGSSIHTPYVLLHHTSYILVCCLSYVQVCPSIQFRPSDIYCCRPDTLELAARLSPWSVAQQRQL